MIKTTTITLGEPLTIDGAQVTEVTMRAPLVRDMVTVDKSGGTEAEKEVRLFANLCSLAPADIEAMELRDYQALQRAYTGFLS